MVKTNLGLVEYCKKQLGLPYWWGTFGQVATQDLLDQKKKQYPSQYTARDFTLQFGKRVHDCVGLIKGYLWTNDKGTIIYTPSQDKDVSGMKANCIIGNIKDIPELKGLLVFMKGHVGVYIGNGEVIEAKGHKYGVVKTKLKDRPWTEYGKLKWINYIEEEELMPDIPEVSITEKREKVKQVANLDEKTINYLFDDYFYREPLLDKFYKLAVDAEKYRNGLK